MWFAWRDPHGWRPKRHSLANLIVVPAARNRPPTPPGSESASPEDTQRGHSFALRQPLHYVGTQLVVDGGLLVSCACNVPASRRWTNILCLILVNFTGPPSIRPTSGGRSHDRHAQFLNLRACGLSSPLLLSRPALAAKASISDSFSLVWKFTLL